MSDMAQISGFYLILLVAAIGGGVLGVLNYLASLVRNQQMVHDLKLEVLQLRSSYLKQLKEMKEREQAGILTGKEPKDSRSRKHK